MADRVPDTGKAFELKDQLKHQPEAFSKEELLRRAKLYGFTQPQFLELLAWDYEIISQLEAANDELILKGGSAAQLFLPLQAQRTSVDVDIIAPSSLQNGGAIKEGPRDGLNGHQFKDGLSTGIERAMEQVRSQLSTLPGFDERKLTPKNPDLVLPMETRVVTLPSNFGQMGRRTCDIKIDFLFADFALPTTTIKEVDTVALKVKNVKAASFGSLVGDKLCTLALGTIGVRKPGDIPKHVYDLEMLEFNIDKLTPEAVADAHYALSSISAFESKIRGKKYSVEEVLESVQVAMESYSRIDLASYAPEMKGEKQNLDYFQQLFLPRGQKKPFYEWSARALKIKFLAGLFLQIEGGLGERKALDALENAKDEEKRLAGLLGRELAQAKEELIEKIKASAPRMKGIKELREKPVGRIYWNAIQAPQESE